MDWVDAKFANRELNSFARLAIELLLDWLTVACWFEVADVVGNKLMVMVVSLL